jgi:MFS family permease
MVGIGETYFPAFVLALSGSQLACGLVTTIPLVAGALLQMLSPHILSRWRSYRRWVVFCALLQAATFVPLGVAAATGGLSVTAVFVIVTLYWATGLASGPPWNVWMENQVPLRLRTRYFTWRSRIAQWGVAAGFLAGGIALHTGVRGGAPLGIFALLFLAAAVSRLFSAGFLASQREHCPANDLTDGLGPSLPRETAPRGGGVFRCLVEGNNGAVLVYLLAAQAAVQIAGPYFTPFMLGHLQFSYSTYATLVCVATISKILFLPAIGRLVQRWGAYRVFWLTALGVIPIPALWLISQAFPWLVVAQTFSGAVWAANDLASLMLFFETIPREKRVRVLTVFNLANAAATATGSLIGGALLMSLGASHAAYLGLFMISALARVAALVFLVRVPAATAVRPARTGRPASIPLPQPAFLSRQRYPQGPHRRREMASAREERPHSSRQ